MNTVKLSRAAEVTGPIGAVIEVDRDPADGGTPVVAVSGEVDELSVPRLRATVSDLAGRGDLVVDLSGVSFCDSRVLSVLVDAQRTSSAAGHRLEVARPSRPVRDLFALSGLVGVLHVTP